MAVPAGVSAYPLETWVDCGVHVGDAFTVRVSGVRAVDPANDRYLDIEGTGHRVVVGNQVPVPVLPAPAVLAMATVLAADGVLRRRGADSAPSCGFSPCDSSGGAARR